MAKAGILTLQQSLPNAVLAFRGYNVTNLGRSRELLEHPKYKDVVAEYLTSASQTCARITGKSVDLIARVRTEQETTLETYAEAIALIVGMELAQLKLLEEFHQVDYRQAKYSMGYSLGEITAIIAGGVISMEDALSIPLHLAEDCAALADDVTLAVVFCRAKPIPLDDVRRTCIRINQLGGGIVGISTYLSPNTILIMGQGDTVDVFKQMARHCVGVELVVRKNQHHWPPLHTPIVWGPNVPNRAGVLMHNLAGGFGSPTPDVLSLVTGRFSYSDFNAREILQRWTDHPQRLWDAIQTTLSQRVDSVIHVGPQPNIIPATFKRLADNVEGQTRANVGVRALAAVARRGWLSALLPNDAALLRAPHMKHIVLEDWLLSESDDK